MRLSEERIEALAGKVADRLRDHPELIRFAGRPQSLADEVERFLLEDLRIEDEINQEALDRLKTYSRNIPQGSTEWMLLLDKHKEEIAARRGYVF